MSNLSNGHRERRLKREFKARCRAAGLPCQWCRQPIDYSLPPNHHSGRQFEADHIISVKDRPDLAYVISNLAPSCRTCNRSKGSRPMPTEPWVVADW